MTNYAVETVKNHSPQPVRLPSLLLHYMYIECQAVGGSVELLLWRLLPSSLEGRKGEKNPSKGICGLCLGCVVCLCQFSVVRIYGPWRRLPEAVSQLRLNQGNQWLCTPLLLSRGKGFFYVSPSEGFVTCVWRFGRDWNSLLMWNDVW